MKKNRKAQSWGMGICATAFGYAMNAKPGPAKSTYLTINYILNEEANEIYMYLYW